MQVELSIAELESEMAAELPERKLMRHHRRFFRRHGRAFAFGHSVTNVNSTNQIIVNPQVAVNLGHGSITQIGDNRNSNSTLQFGIV